MGEVIQWPPSTFNPSPPKAPAPKKRRLLPSSPPLTLTAHGLNSLCRREAESIPTNNPAYRALSTMNPSNPPQAAEYGGGTYFALALDLFLPDPTDSPLAHLSF